MGRVVLVTGTDTGVGKTWVACGLARALRSAGATVAARKPAETGCGASPVSAGADAARTGCGTNPNTRAREPGGAGLVGAALWPADAAALSDAAGGTEDLAEVCAYRFAEPLAPAVAARRAGVSIDVAGLVVAYRARAREVDVLLVEGAGGLLVPLGDGSSFADLAVSVGAELIVVVGARLGAINHALLTLEVARARRLGVLGVVVNHFSLHRDLATETLGETLSELAGAPILATVRHGEDAAAAFAGAACDLTRVRP